MIENESFLIDSNILIYAFDKDEKEKNHVAKNLLVKILNGEMTIYLSTQNLSEFYYNTTKKIKKPLDSIEAKEIIADIISLSNVKIIKINENSILNAIDISSENKVSYWDALIASVMRENRVYNIITENDKDFRKIPWLKVTNPFFEKAKNDNNTRKAQYYN